MHNTESVLENEMPKILWDFEMQTAYLISARRPDLVIVKKKKKKKKERKREKEESLPNSRLYRPGWPQDKTEKKQKER